MKRTGAYGKKEQRPDPMSDLCHGGGWYTLSGEMRQLHKQSPKTTLSVYSACFPLFQRDTGR